MKNQKNKYKCPCCGFLTLEEQSSGTYEICPVCYWEDDPVQSDDPSYEGGANKISLTQARINFKEFGACSRESIKNVRPPTEVEREISKENKDNQKQGLSTFVLYDYVHNMLVYWDPWNLIHGAWAPNNEYDSYIDRIIEIVEASPCDEEVISKKLEGIFLNKEMPQNNVNRAIKGMTEGILYYMSKR
jgi:hypothetical protein